MIIVRTRDKPLDAGNRPDWCRATSAGRFFVPCDGGRFDLHFHDCDEYWLIYAGCGKIVVGDVEAEVEPGDIVCTPAGIEHDVLEVYADLAAFWFELETPPGGRIGHLHRSAVAAVGHLVPARPRPAPRRSAGDASFAAQDQRLTPALKRCEFLRTVAEVRALLGPVKKLSIRFAAGARCGRRALFSVTAKPGAVAPTPIE